MNYDSNTVLALRASRGKNYERILMKFFGGVRHGQKKESIKLGWRSGLLDGFWIIFQDSFTGRQQN